MPPENRPSMSCCAARSIPGRGIGVRDPPCGPGDAYCRAASDVQFKVCAILRERARRTRRAVRTRPAVPAAGGRGRSGPPSRHGPSSRTTASSGSSPGLAGQRRDQRFRQPRTDITLPAAPPPSGAGPGTAGRPRWSASHAGRGSPPGRRGSGRPAAATPSCHRVSSASATLDVNRYATPIRCDRWSVNVLARRDVVAVWPCPPPAGWCPHPERSQALSWLFDGLCSAVAQVPLSWDQHAQVVDRPQRRGSRDVTTT